MNAAPLLQTSGLGKEYDGRWAVHGLDLTVRPGEIYGFLGRNGAGKTTTIRMVVGLIRPSAGSVRLFSRADPGPAVFARLAATIEYPGFYPGLTARENLLYHAKMRGVPPARVNAVLDTFGLADAADRLTRGFSLGMKQRLGLARAMLHSPAFLLLDEPTNGLDPAGIREIRETIRRLNREQGITILLSSHILSEVEQVATRVGIIHQGRLVDEFSLAEFSAAANRRLVLRVSDPAAAVAALGELGIGATLAEGGEIHIHEQNHQPHLINRALVARGIDVSHLSLWAETLEDRFMRLTGGGQDVQDA